MREFYSKSILLLIIGISLFNSSSAFSQDDAAIRARVRKSQRDGAIVEVKSTIGWTACAAVGGACAAYFTPLGALAVGSAALYTMKDSVTNMASYCGLGVPSENLALVQKLNSFEEDLEIKRAYLLEFNRLELDRLFKRARNKIGYGIKPIRSYDQESSDKLLNKIEAILSIPLHPSTPCVLDQALANLGEHLSTYSDSVHDDVINAAVKIHKLGTSQASGADGDQRISYKSSYIFLGEAGVGKTETAEAIAMALNRPFCKFNLGSDRVEDFFGHAPNIVAGPDQMGTMGGFARCFIKPDRGSPASDPIIFVDEIHDVLNADGKESRALYGLLKFISEGREIEVLDKGLDIKLLIGSATFIFATNEKVKKDSVGALASRMKVIEFLNLTKDQKREIANKIFKKLCQKYAYDSNTADPNVLEKIINCDASSGARVLINVIEEYIVDRITRSCARLRCSEFDVGESIRKNGGLALQN